MKRFLAISLAVLMLFALGCASTTPARETNEVGDLFDQLAETEEQAKERIYSSVRNKLMTDAEKQEMTAAERSQNDELESVMQNALQNGTREELEQRIAEWSAFAEDLREVFSAYKKSNLTPFSDAELSMLSKDELNEYYSYQQKIDEAYFARNVKDLNLLNNQWQSFQSDAKNTVEAARDKMLNDWVSGADLGSAITGLFSLGTIKTTTTVSGHRITVSTQYLTDYGASDAQIKNAMDSYLNLMSSMFQNTVNSLGFYMDDVAIRVEYKNMNGKVVSEKEFKVTKATKPAGFNPPDKYYPNRETIKSAAMSENGASVLAPSSTSDAISAEQTAQPQGQVTTFVPSQTSTPSATQAPILPTIESGVEVEDNNSYDKANEILVGETYSGTLSADFHSEQDWFTFSIETEAVVVVSFLGSKQNNSGSFWDISLRSGADRSKILWQQFIDGIDPESDGQEIFLLTGTYYFEVESSDYYSADTYNFSIAYCDHQYVPLSQSRIINQEGYQKKDTAATSLGEEWQDCFTLGAGNSYDYGIVEIRVPDNCTILELSFAALTGTKNSTVLVTEIFGNDETNLFFESDGITYKTRTQTIFIYLNGVETIGIKTAPTEMNTSTHYERMLFKGRFHKDNQLDIDGITIDGYTRTISVCDLPLIAKDGYEELPAAVDHQGIAWGRCISLGAFSKSKTYMECFIDKHYKTVTISACLRKGAHEDTNICIYVYGDNENEPLYVSEILTIKTGIVVFDVDLEGHSYLKIEAVNIKSNVVNSGDKVLIKTVLE